MSFCKIPLMDNNSRFHPLCMSLALYLLRYLCFVVKCTSLWYIYHVCPWTSGSLYVIKLTTNLPGLPYGYENSLYQLHLLLQVSLYGGGRGQKLRSTGFSIEHKDEQEFATLYMRLIKSSGQLVLFWCIFLCF
jgi:hypothetical protein